MRDALQARPKSYYRVDLRPVLEAGVSPLAFADLYHLAVAGHRMIAGEMVQMLLPRLSATAISDD